MPEYAVIDMRAPAKCKRDFDESMLRYFDNHTFMVSVNRKTGQIKFCVAYPVFEASEDEDDFSDDEEDEEEHEPVSLRIFLTRQAKYYSCTDCSRVFRTRLRDIVNEAVRARALDIFDDVMRWSFVPQLLLHYGKTRTADVDHCGLTCGLPECKKAPMGFMRDCPILSFCSGTCYHRFVCYTAAQKASVEFARQTAKAKYAYLWKAVFQNARSACPCHYSDYPAKEAVNEFRTLLLEYKIHEYF